MSSENLLLRDVVALNYGKSLPEGARSPGEIPVYGSGGITGAHHEALVRGPGIIIGRKGTVGSVFWEARDFFPIDTVYFAEPIKDGSDRKFIYYLLKSLPLARMNSDAAVPGLNREAAYALRVQLPSPAVQRRVAAVLSSYDDLIENNRRRIALLEQSARLLYREWFVHLRFPGHEHVKVVGGVPEGWGWLPLADVCQYVEDGDWIESKDQGGDDYRLLQVSNIGVDSFVETGNFRYVSGDTFRRLHCREVLPGDVLISRMPEPIGRAWLVTEKPWRMITAVDVAIARVSPSVVAPYFLIQHLNASASLELAAKHATGATRLRIARRSLCALPLLVPPLDVQHEFGEVVEANYQLRVNLEKQNEKLRQARDLLLPRVMSGQIQLNHTSYA